MKKLIFLLLFVASFYTAAQAQETATNRVLFESKEHLVEDLLTALKTARVPEATALHQLVDSVWNSGLLVPSQKDLIYEITWKLKLEGYNTAPYIRDYFACLAYGLSTNRFPEGQFDQFLTILQQMLNEKDSQKFIMSRFLRSTRAFMQLGILYKNRDYQLRVERGEISFEYIFDDENNYSWKTQ